MAITQYGTKNPLQAYYDRGAGAKRTRRARARQYREAPARRAITKSSHMRVPQPVTLRAYLHIPGALRRVALVRK